MPSHQPAYVGRFAPSPSGPLHQGSLLAAMASFLDARAHRGLWLLRLEDIDTPRVVAGADRRIMAQLHALGMPWDGEVIWQSQRTHGYARAFERLRAAHRVYGCRCTRAMLPAGPYPGTCRPAEGPSRPEAPFDAPVRSWRFRVDPGIESFTDRWHGPQSQDVAAEAGDFIIRRADGLWAYQLAVVVDDGTQGVTDVVRGSDLLDSTARQRQLGRALGLPLPRTLHVPVLCDRTGRKLSKQNHAPALAPDQALPCLHSAWQSLGFDPIPASSPAEFWPAAVERWARRFGMQD